MNEIEENHETEAEMQDMGLDDLGACPRIRFWRRKALLSNLVGD